MKSDEIKSIEDFLYWNGPFGFPCEQLKIYCAFEVGGAYEDWGYVLEYKGKTYATCRSGEINNMLTKARLKLREEAGINK